MSANYERNTVVGLKADDLVFEAEDFLEPVGHPLVEFLFGFYFDFFDLVFESKRYHLAYSFLNILCKLM